MNDVADIIIIGAGASGAAAAWYLSEHTDHKIICLEQGDYVDAGRYPTHKADWELAKFSDFSVSPNIRSHPADYPIDDSASPISLANYNAVGGSTILYSGHFPRFHPSDFRVRTLDGVAEDWPVSYSELEPYFALNDKMMGVAGLSGDPAYPPIENLLPPIPLGEMGRRLAVGFNNLGWHWWPSYSAINTGHHNGRAACINLGPCNTGCSQGAKSSVDVTYWPKALQNGVVLKTNCRAKEVELALDGRVSQVIYFDPNNDIRSCSAKIIIMACSGVGTPRLLLNSISERYPNGLSNDSGLVGKNLMLHPLGFVEGLFEENINSNIGPQGCCLYSHQFYETDPERNYIRGFTMQILRGSSPIETAVGGFLKREISCGTDHHRDFNKKFGKVAGIATIIEDLPEADNKIELDYTKRDSSGMPGVRVHYKLSENSKNMLKAGIEASRSIFKSCGASVTASFAPVRNTGWHIMGTACMGNDPGRSVVNRWGQSHSVKNLFIVDSSIFVTSGAVNPVSTLQALALFISHHIHKNYSDLVA